MAPADSKIAAVRSIPANCAYAIGRAVPAVSIAKIDTTRSTAGIGRAVISSPRTNPRIDALLPTPSAMVSTIARVQIGARKRARAE